MNKKKFEAIRIDTSLELLKAQLIGSLRFTIKFCSALLFLNFSNLGISKSTRVGGAKMGTVGKMGSFAFSLFSRNSPVQIRNF